MTSTSIRPARTAPPAPARRRRDRSIGPRRPRRWEHVGDRARLVLLGALAVAAMAAFLTINTRGDWAFALELRSRTLLGLVLVSVAIGWSTVVFQTITENRILTPQIMGFDSLYELIQTGMVFFLGATAVNRLAGPAMFGLELAAMLGLSLALFWWLFGGRRRDVVLLVLVGIVFGTFFRSISTFMQRVIDPNESLIITDRLFASFTSVDASLLPYATAGIVLSSLGIWLLRRRLDVVALGPSRSTALGLNYRGLVLGVLSLGAVQVAVATALVGPVLFFGLIVSNVAYQICRSSRHAIVLPASALVAITMLIGAQAVLQHALGLGTVLSVIIEFVGGLVFIALLVRGRNR
ncbi:iron chelate uptake ABC transporter family permease subunit [Pseudactinotalea sp. HY158]|uniref:iron chelate uptake ABC transporter family permease subunit n=1 Tax=Pseudactinotalea sp. HY158 TaxID=2654547 RepID=UPI00129D19DE|nr:iron chelate uptake ABC transporter family permease subunit [Pseudactinotalea sp. HY158]QGH69314.1 iron chelate uptake ABC transporter family permease subunit [Pseudactinotalea sp. HY158]